ncbi:hypothetical protein P3S68_009848 [Capsicum galapagoense]
MNAVLTVAMQMWRTYEEWDCRSQSLKLQTVPSKGKRVTPSNLGSLLPLLRPITKTDAVVMRKVLMQV